MPERYEPTNNKGLSEYDIHTAVNIIVSMQRRGPLINSEGLVITELIRIAGEIVRESKRRRDLSDWMNI